MPSSHRAAIRSGIIRQSLPLAALVSAALPVPVTLSALVKAPDTATDTGSGTDDSDQPPAPAIDITGANALTLMAVAHGTAAPQTQPAASLTPACGGLTPASASTGPSFPTLTLSTVQGANVQAAYARDAGTGQTTPPLPQPGFTLLPDITSDTPTTQAASLARANAATSPSPQPSITLTAATAIAMADPAQLSTTGAQPGFTLLADVTPVAAPRLAATATPSGSSGKDAVTSATATTTAVRMAQATATAAPIMTADPAVLTADVTPATTAPVRLASARTGAVGRATPVAAQSATTATETTARPAIDLDAGKLDAGDPQPGFSAHSPTSPSADGVSVLDNAPSLTQPLASAGTAAAAQSLAATGGAATTTFAAQQGGSDMAALVDRLVEARAAARSGLSSPVVQASLTHTDFGRVSLRFNSDEDGLSVSMASSDPDFAPAAQAALAQAPAVSASAQGHGAGQQSMGQQGSGQPGLHWAQSSAQPALQANTGGTGSSGQGGQGWTQGGQTNAPASQTTPAAQARATGSSTSTSPRNRGGILA
jgi:hypothetical protein